VQLYLGFWLVFIAPSFDLVAWLQDDNTESQMPHVPDSGLNYSL